VGEMRASIDAIAEWHCHSSTRARPGDEMTLEPISGQFNDALQRRLVSATGRSPG
jgi:hypothetical protein